MKKWPVHAVVLVMLIWSFCFIIIKGAINYIAPGLVIALRSIIASFILFFFALNKFKKANKKVVILGVVTGIILAAGYIIQTISLEYTASGMTSLLENAYMFVIPFLTWLLTKKRPSFVSFVTIGLSIVGVILVSLSNIDFNNSGSVLGVVLAIIAGVLFGINICLTGCLEKEKDPIVYTFIQFSVVSIIALSYSLIIERKAPIFNTQSILSILYLGILATALAWILRNYAQNKLSTFTVSLILPFTSVIATIISIVLREVELSVPFVIGVVILFTSTILDGLFEQYQNKKAEKNN